MLHRKWTRLQRRSIRQLLSNFFAGERCYSLKRSQSSAPIMCSLAKRVASNEKLVTTTSAKTTLISALKSTPTPISIKQALPSSSSSTGQGSKRKWRRPFSVDCPRGDTRKQHWRRPSCSRNTVHIHLVSSRLVLTTPFNSFLWRPCKR